MCLARASVARLSQRADSIGVSVKLTSSETRIANAIVRPKLFMKRPTMPPMKATGRKTATSDSVVASTARPISCVAVDRRLERRSSFFSSMKRKMFSSTTIASSMTMPTDEREREQRQRC